VWSRSRMSLWQMSAARVASRCASAYSEVVTTCRFASSITSGRYSGPVSDCCTNVRSGAPPGSTWRVEARQETS